MMEQDITQQSDKEKKLKTISGKVPQRIADRLKAMADAEKRTVSFYVHEFVTEALERLDQQQAA